MPFLVIDWPSSFKNSFKTLSNGLSPYFYYFAMPMFCQKYVQECLYVTKTFQPKNFT